MEPFFVAFRAMDNKGYKGQRARREAGEHLWGRSPPSMATLRQQYSFLSMSGLA